MTKTIDIHTTQIGFDDILSLIRQGTEIIMTDVNIQLARLVPYFPLRKKQIAGLAAH